LESIWILDAFEPGIGELVYGSNWTETSLMLAFIEIPGMCVVPDKVLTASFDQIRVKVTNEKGLIEIEMVNLTTWKASVKALIEKESQG
jgi:hypothetical protein